MTAETPPHPPGDRSGPHPPPGIRDASAGPGSASGYVDLGAMILGDEPPPVTTRLTDDEHSGPGEDFRTALSRLRVRLIRNLPSGDARTHQDMGTAYRTMGLDQEAIGEFQQAIREDPSSPAAHEMLGRCFLDAELPDLAAGALGTALRLVRGSQDEFPGIYYYMGRAQEAAGNPEEAYDFYRKTLAIDIDFQDVAGRVRDLRRALRGPTGESGDRVSGDPT